MEPNFENFTLLELYEAKENIDRETYNDRYLTVCKLIEVKENTGNLSEKEKLFVETRKGFNSKLGCETAILFGFYGGLVYAALNILSAFIGYGSSKEYKLEPNIYIPANVIVISLIIALSILVKLKSRIAATIQFAIFVISVLLTWFVYFRFGGLLTIAAFSLVFFSSMMATFLWHAKYKQKALP